jgi:hypothetical protein
MSTNFKGSINRSVRRLAIQHTSTRKKIKNISSLGKKKSRRVMKNCNTQKMMKKTKISHRKLRTKKCDNVIYERLRGRSKNNIININKQIRNIIIMVVNKERCIGKRRGKINSLNKGRKSLKPTSGSLF